MNIIIIIIVVVIVIIMHAEIGEWRYRKKCSTQSIMSTSRLQLGFIFLN